MEARKSRKEQEKTDSPLRILAAGDLHGDSGLAEMLAKKAEKEHVDLVVIAGDISEDDDLPDGIMKPFKQRQLKVVFVPGNHDSIATADFLSEFYKIKNLHGYSVRYKDVGLFGAGGTTIGTGIIGPRSTFEEKEVFELLRKGWEKINYLKKKIMVTHVHPQGSLSEKMSGIAVKNGVSGSTAVRMAIDNFKPDILLCCHIHEAEGIEEKIGKTRVISVGKKGKIIEI
ncbi:MAG: metallophosphoesterase [Candidatus Woesearchaeota archaeon]